MRPAARPANGSVGGPAPGSPGTEAGRPAVDEPGTWPHVLARTGTTEQGESPAQAVGSPGPPPASATEIFGPGLASAVEYARLLATDGMVQGVIGPREAGRIWERHLLNSAVLAAAMPSGAVVVDIGSGAGLPGIPIAIARPDVRVHLVEPLRRRVVWLRFVVEALALEDRVQILHGRAEELDPVPGDVVVSRAVAPLRRLLPWCARWCRVGGLVVALKGERAADELADVVDNVVAWGLGETSVARFGEGVLTQPALAVVCRRLADPGGGQRRTQKSPSRGQERERTSHAARHRP